MAYKDLDFHGNVYRVYADGTAECIECRNTVPPPDHRLVRCGNSPFWANERGEKRASALTQKLNIVAAEIEMELREGITS